MNSKIYSKKAQRLKYVISDLIAGSIAFLLFNIFRYCFFSEIYVGKYGVANYLSQSVIITEQIFVPIAILIIYWLSGFYNEPLNKSRLQEFCVTFFSSLFCAMLLFMAFLSGDGMESKLFAPVTIFTFFVLLFTFSYIGRLSITTSAIKFYRNNKIKSNILIIGCSRKALDIVARLNKPDSFQTFNCIGFVKIKGETNVISESDYEIWDSYQLNEAYITTKGINQIFIAPENRIDKEVMSYLNKLLNFKIPIRIASDTFSIITSGVNMKDIMADPFIDLTSPRISEFSKNIKLASDYILSIFIGTLLSPILIISIIFVKATSKGAAIYSQERIGKHNKPFKIYKIRTMVENAENNFPQLSSDTDKRITKIGKKLRKYHIDEIPQFFNVLKGDMSIVGPRPEREYYIQEILKKAPYYCLLNQVKPGITSWGMVKYGYASNITQMIERAKYDLIYLNNMSITIDLKIMIYTLKAIFSGSGK